MRALVVLAVALVSVPAADAAPRAKCRAPLTQCDGACVDLRTDASHCGSCAVACQEGQRCTAGACAPTCGPPLAACGERCADVRNDPASCGACDAACAEGQLCDAGACRDRCEPLSACAGACVDPRRDPANCGGCGVACAPGEACDAGACRPTGCSQRAAGAFVTLAICGQSLKLWVTNPTFVQQAEGLLAGAPPLIPFLELRDGGDCDGEWTWHADPATVAFGQFAIELCDGCPVHVEADKPYWLSVVQSYCPWSAQVVAVERR